MTRELNTVQARRWKRPHIAPVYMVKLTTYTDRTASTVDKIYYLSNVGCIYDYGDTGVDQNFLPVVVGGSDFVSEFNHLPQPDDLTAFERTFDLQLTNETINGSRMAVLLQQHNLEGASIEISIFVEGVTTFTLPLDLTSYSGTQHTVLFRGRVDRVAPITDSFLTLVCRNELPSMASDWNYALDGTKTDPIDLGKRLPRIYGKARRVPCVNWDVGWVTTLAEAVTSSETSVVNVTDASGIPSQDGYTIRIDGEEIACNYASGISALSDVDKQIGFKTRGVNSTTAAAHEAGAVVSVLQSSMTYIASDRACDAFNALYVINPLNGELMELVSSASYYPTVSLADTTTIPGRTVTSFTFTSTQMRALWDAFKVQVAAVGGITTQPAFSIDDPQVILLETIAHTNSTSHSDGDAMQAATGLGTSTVRHLGNTSGTKNYTDGWWPSSSIPSSSRVIKRWRLRGEMNGHNDHTGVTEDMTIGVKTNGMSGTPLNGSAGETATVTVQNNTTDYGLVAVGTWHTPSASTALSAFESSGSILVHTYASMGGGGTLNTTEWMEWTFFGVEIELEPSALTRDTDVASNSGPSTGFGLRFFADADGIEVGNAPVLTWSDGYSFDSGTWSTANCSVAVDTSDKVEGTGSQKITIAGPTPDIQTDATTNWTGVNCTVTAPTDEGHNEGTACIKGVVGTASDATMTFSDATVAMDISAGAFAMDFKINKNGLTNNFVHFQIGNDASNYYWFDVKADDLPDGKWVTLLFWPSDADFEQGTVTDTDIDYLIVRLNYVVNLTDVAGIEVFVDNIRALSTLSAVIQNVAAGSVDLSVSQTDYRVALKQDAQTIFEVDPVKVYVSDDALSPGTTLPSSYRKITFAPLLKAGGWEALPSTATADVGAVTHTAITIVRVEIDIAPPTTRINTRYSTDQLIFRVDDLELPNSVDAAWKGTVGDPMSHPADILRHMIQVVGGETHDSTSYDALYTSLGASAEWGFDLRSLGYQWDEILQRMAFESRCNVVAVETSTGREWKMLAADNDTGGQYGFNAPGSTAIISQTHGLTDIGRGIDDLANFFTFRFGYDASFGGGGSEEDFRKVLRALPTRSDLDVPVATIAASVAAFGAVQADPIAFRCIQDVETAKDVAAYYVHERIDNTRRVYELDGVAWFEGMLYDVGDIVSITAPWAAAATTCRITSLRKSFRDHTWTIQAVEVDQ